MAVKQFPQSGSEFDDGTTTLVPTVVLVPDGAIDPVTGIVSLALPPGSGNVPIQFKYNGSNLGAQGTVSSIDFRGAGVIASRSTNALTVNVGDLGWVNVQDYGAVGNGIADDSAAINSAIVAAVALGYATIYFPRGIYLCNGSLLGSVRKSVLRIPVLNGDTAWASIEFRGCAPPAFPGFGSVSLGTDNMFLSGSIIKSTGDNGSVFGAEPGLVGGAAFNASRVIFRNLTVLTKDNPTRSGIDTFYNLQASFDNVLVTTGKYHTGVTEPSTPGVTGIFFPQFFNATFCDGRTCHVTGYYDGYNYSELATGNVLWAYDCKRAHVFSAGGLSHALNFGRLGDSACEQGLVFDATSNVSIQQYDAERAVTGWQTRLYDIAGPGGIPQGQLQNYYIQIAGNGAANTLLVDSPSTVDYFPCNRIGPVRYDGSWNCSGTTQSIGSGAFVGVQWQAQEDAGGGYTWSSSVNPDQITIRDPGYYQIVASVGFETNATGFRQLYLNSSRTGNDILAAATTTAISGEETVVQLSATVWLSVGNVITIQAHQNSGSSLLIKNAGAFSFYSKLQITKVG